MMMARLNTGLLLLLPLSTVVLVATTWQAADGQFSTPSSTASTSTPTFQNITEGFRIQVPSGWVVDEFNQANSPDRQQAAAQVGWNLLAGFCPEEHSLPKVGGQYDCTGYTGPDLRQISIIEFLNLNSTRPEFAALLSRNQSITIDDIVALEVDLQRERYGFEDDTTSSGLQIESQLDRTVNVIDPVTNQMVKTVPAKEVKFRVDILEGEEEGTSLAGYTLVVLDEDRNKAYAVHTFGRILSEEEIPSFARQAFDSFELLESQ